MDIYILQKDLLFHHDKKSRTIKAGAEFKSSSSGLFFICDKEAQAFSKEVIENNPEWFKKTEDKPFDEYVEFTTSLNEKQRSLYEKILAREFADTLQKEREKSWEYQKHQEEAKKLKESYDTMRGEMIKEAIQQLYEIDKKASSQIMPVNKFSFLLLAESVKGWVDNGIKISELAKELECQFSIARNYL